MGKIDILDIVGSVFIVLVGVLMALSYWSAVAGVEWLVW
jgi:hypothetical protein